MKNYIEFNVEILRIENTDIVTASSFFGETDDFGVPGSSSSSDGLYGDNA